MLHLHHKRYVSIILAILAIGVIFLLLYKIKNDNNAPLVTATAETGSVRQMVSVSGMAEAQQSAELAFPVSGIVSSVAVEEGDVVKAGDVLVTLDTRSLEAERKDALAAVAQAIANRDELVAGPTTASREVTSETVALKHDALNLTTQTEERKVENAYRALLSSNLEALSKDPNELSTPPTVTGTYRCGAEGTYTVSIYSSGAESGYSYNYTGLESGTASVSTNQPTPLGSCGLYLQFDSTSSYSRSVWEIAVPNTKSSSYVTNLNSYNLAKTQAENAIAVAKQELTLSEATASNTNAPARAEALARANAVVSQAQARLDKVDAAIQDRVLRAPFSGTVTVLDVIPGETVTTVPILTLLAEEAFDVTAKIPEIDIGKLAVGQKVEMVFDARADEVVGGEVSFISLQATEIDGVAYYEAHIEFAAIPPWIRSGLSADIDIIINEVTDVVRVPKRFVSPNGTGATVLQKQGDIIASTTITVLLTGDDGWTAITGLNEGDTIVAP